MVDWINLDLINFTRVDTNKARKGRIIEQYIDKDHNPLRIITDISRVNLFVGANNSGKSRLLRDLFFNMDYNFADLTEDNTFQISNIFDQNNNNEKLVQLKKEWNKVDEKNKSERIAVILNWIVKIVNNSSCYGDVDINRANNLITAISRSTKNNDKKGIKKVYIPTLRGVECFQESMAALQESKLNALKMTTYEQISLNEHVNQVNTVYYKKTCKVYFDDKSIPFGEVYTGELLYQDIQNRLLGEKKARESIKEFEEFLSKHFFANKNVSLIPNKAKNYLCINIEGENEDRELHNLGDGIKHLIVITYKMFIHKDETALFFVEEPELNLHPGLQRKLIEVMLSPTFDKQQFFITTHSNHLLDLTLDYENMSVYKFKKIILHDENKVVFTRARKGDNSLLQELGVKASSVFLSNCTIWVEGITDRLFIRKYLELYQKQLNNNQPVKEDIDYSFVEYGGSNITHWNFENDNNDNDKEQINTRYLSKHIFLIEDKDFPEKDTKKYARHKQFAETLGGEYYELPVREIENLVSVKVLKKIISDREGKEYVSYAKDIKENMYKKEPMGKFIDGIVNNGKKYTQKDGKTLYNKVDFCHRALKNLDTYNDLSKNAQELTEKVYDFISNKK